jgi:hypothetical protein
VGQGRKIVGEKVGRCCFTGHIDTVGTSEDILWEMKNNNIYEKLGLVSLEEISQ